MQQLTRVEHAELHPGVFDMEPGDDLRLGFSQVEGSPT